MTGRTTTTATTAAAPPGQRIYAIGDVHGRADLLVQILGLIEADLRRAGKPGLIIPLGDYIDRGPASAEVLRRVVEGDFPAPVHPLRGNHEEMLLAFLDDAAVLDHWGRNGGLQTLTSFGVDVERPSRGTGYEAARLALRDRLGASAIAVLQGLPTSLWLGDYFFCHAGVRPGVPLEAQQADDLVWIRHEFLLSTEPFGAVVVHGHTPAARPEVRPNRINIDTGAFATGVLTALVLDGTDRAFLSTANL
ncbi:metallophosphoesterase family protein [Chelatococcus reniformis]|uniref:Metallophosphoesterase n=1 Tax=Chelatococcus reniformis TaxID=1494448 RepID=A0A916TZX0_9HYPH|nr:metallophosphoesterase family protein [Chelatococcus reniformis]GGC49592.1 metallophosphoesterase [Chelatococcus reniformis]